MGELLGKQLLITWHTVGTEWAVTCCQVDTLRCVGLLVSEGSSGKVSGVSCILSETWKCDQRDQRTLLGEARAWTEGWQPGRKAPGGLGTSCVLGDVLPYHTEPFTRCCRHIQVDFASRVTALFLPAHPALQDAGGYVMSERRDTFYIHFARVVWFLLLAFVLGQIC